MNLLLPISTLMDFTGATNAHGPSPQPVWGGWGTNSGANILVQESYLGIHVYPKYFCLLECENI